MIRLGQEVCSSLDENVVANGSKPTGSAALHHQPSVASILAVPRVTVGCDQAARWSHGLAVETGRNNSHLARLRGANC